MTISKREMERIAQSFNYIAADAAADHATVVKLVQEFCNAATSINPRFKREVFVAAVFGEGHKVINGWSNTNIGCGACGYDLFYNRGRSLDTFNHECARCGHMNHTMTETGMSA